MNWDVSSWSTSGYYIKKQNSKELDPHRCKHYGVEKFSITRIGSFLYMETVSVLIPFLPMRYWRPLSFLWLFVSPFSACLLLFYSFYCHSRLICVLWSPWVAPLSSRSQPAAGSCGKTQCIGNAAGIGYPIDTVAYGSSSFDGDFVYCAQLRLHVASHWSAFHAFCVQ